MEEIFVAACTLVVVILVILGVRNRRRLGESAPDDSIVDGIEKYNLYMSNTPNVINQDRFRYKLSKAGFSDAAIQDMQNKVIEMKGTASDLDALAIINALGPLMKLNS